MTRNALETSLIRQLDGVVERYEAAVELFGEASEFHQGNWPGTTVHEMFAAAVAAIERATPQRSAYRHMLDALHDSSNAKYVVDVINMAGSIGIARPVRRDIDNGFVTESAAMVHAETFDEFLDMAVHLCEQGYKDAAAVIGGSSLETHLRNLARKFQVAVTSNDRPKKADLINAELVKAGAYPGLDQKSVTTWLGLRNHAAHGEYSAYDVDQVKLLIDGVRNFMARHPA